MEHIIPSGRFRSTPARANPPKLDLKLLEQLGVTAERTREGYVIDDENMVKLLEQLDRILRRLS